MIAIFGIASMIPHLHYIPRLFNDIKSGYIVHVYNAIITSISPAPHL